MGARDRRLSGRIETWADYDRLPDDAAEPLCDGTRIGRFMNAEVGRWGDDQVSSATVTRTRCYRRSGSAAAGAIHPK